MTTSPTPSAPRLARGHAARSCERPYVLAAWPRAGLGWAHRMRVVVMGVLTALIMGCSATEEAPEQPTVSTERGDLTYTGVYYGELQAAESVDVHVPDVPETSQLTVDSVLEDGTRVAKGDVILSFVRETLELDLRDELEKLAVAKAARRKVAQQLDKERIDLELEVKRKELALARAKLQVVEGINLISKLELDKAKLDVKKAELELKLAKKALTTFEQKRATAMKVEDLEVEAAQRKVDTKREGLDLIEVHAPVDGVIYAPYTRLNWQRTKVAPGVVARPGDKILEIPDLSSYHVEVYVRQRDAALIHVGNEATITPLILPDRTIAGRVIAKEDFATTRNERLGTEGAAGNLKEYLVTVEMDEAPEVLRPGNSARVDIISHLAEDATLLPVIYVHKNAEDHWVVTRPDGTTSPVELGRTNLTHVAITDGLAPGEPVVLPREDATQRGEDAVE